MNTAKPLPGETVDLFAQAVSALPLLPTIIQYEDDYDEKVRSVKLSDTKDNITIFVSGQSTTLDFFRYAPRVRQLLRSYLLFSIGEFATISVVRFFRDLAEISALDIEYAASEAPIELQKAWSRYQTSYSPYQLATLKGLLAFLCNINFMAWSNTYRKFISRAFPVSMPSAHLSVRSGDAFLKIDEEALLVRWFDDAALNAKAMSLPEVEVACLLVSSYQFGMRPKQLGIIRMRDCTIRFSKEDGSAMVHLSFRILKQKDPTLTRFPLVRKVKREWAPMFVRLLELKQGNNSDDFLFGFDSRVSLSNALSKKLSEILPESERRVAYDLRHSMAQRLVDAGANHEDLASALGHTNLVSGLIYFRQSANQAELVNKALGLSDVYQVVASIAKDKFISEEQLRKLKGEQQIAGAPHGIPVSGIGGCSTGQPSCPFNPVTACYGCEKFMPVRDLPLHKQVLAEFRGVVNQFKDVGRGETSSPAFLQLRRTISEIQDVIHDLESPIDE